MTNDKSDKKLQKWKDGKNMKEWQGDIKWQKWQKMAEITKNESRNQNKKTDRSLLKFNIIFI